MSEWWTYRLSSFVMFSPRTYLRLHELYNEDIWPAQWIALAVGIAIAALASRRAAFARIGVAMLALCWCWTAWKFHAQRYAAINWAATYFAAAFIAQAVALAVAAVQLRDAAETPVRVPRAAGLLLAVFALVGQPLLARLAGRSVHAIEYFGVAPDPTVVATLGVLLMQRRLPWGLWVVPVLWCAISGAFQWTLKFPDAPVPLLAALLAITLRWRARAR
jgi:hypothetical protein